jgi:hypothetical protein
MPQHLPLQDPPKFTQSGIFGLKICHLATVETTHSEAKKLCLPITGFAVAKNWTAAGKAFNHFFQFQPRTKNGFATDM